METHDMMPDSQTRRFDLEIHPSFFQHGLLAGNLVFTEWSRNVLRVSDWRAYGEERGDTRATLAGRTAEAQEEEEKEEEQVTLLATLFRRIA